jgi:diadenosine tetraphosphate (Ap4A) HIT family hydrolase
MSGICVFCDIDANDESVQWYDRPIWCVPGLAFLVPSLGALVPGYLLLVPETHVYSFRQVKLGLRPALARMACIAIKRLSLIYGPVTAFEHGACGEALSGSACINHAHLHLVPGVYGLTNHLGKDRARFESLGDFLKASGNDPYLMCQDPGGPVVSAPDAGLGQYFRRIIARELLVPDEWDYALYRRFDNISATYKELGRWDDQLEFGLLGTDPEPLEHQ